MATERTSLCGQFVSLTLVTSLSVVCLAGRVFAEPCTTNPATKWEDFFVASDGSFSPVGARAATVGITDCGDFIVAFQVGSDERGQFHRECPDEEPTDVPAGFLLPTVAARRFAPDGNHYESAPFLISDANDYMGNPTLPRIPRVRGAKR